MKNIYLIAFLVISSHLCAQKVSVVANGDLTIIELTGSAYERGFTHGELLKDEIQEVIQRFKDDIAETTKIDPDEFIATFNDQTNYTEAIEKWTPELMDEIRGISDGSGIDFETIFMHQLGDEYWFNTEDLMAHHCSSIGVDKTDNHASMAGQNMDIPSYYHGFQTVLNIEDPKSNMKMMVLTFPGMIGLTGLNDHQVSINCNTLMQLDYGRSGLPVAFIVRGVLAKSSQKEALKFLNTIQHASGQNYIVGGPKNVHSMECSANKIVEFKPFENSFFTYHTNHPMSNDDYNQKYLKRLNENGRSLEEGLYECQRIKSFERRFSDEKDDIGIEEIKTVLRARDGDSPDVVSNDYTFSSVIYVLSENPKFIIAPGKPHEKDYLELSFE